MYSQIFDILETVSQIAKERMIEMLKHATFSDHIPHALRPYDYNVISRRSLSMIPGVQTFIFSDVFERKRQTGVLALYNSDFAESSFANNSEQAEVVEIYYKSFLSVPVIQTNR